MNEYLSAAEAEILWTNVTLEKLEARPVVIPEENAPPEHRVLTSGHLAIHPDAPRIIEEQQMRSGDSSLDS